METKQAVATLGALAQESRLDIVRLLIRHGVGGLPAGRIAAALGLNPATLSFHLSALRNAGLVSSVRVSRQIIYTVDFRAVSALAEFLLANCCVECVPGDMSVERTPGDVSVERTGRPASRNARRATRATERSPS